MYTDIESVIASRKIQEVMSEQDKQNANKEWQRIIEELLYTE